MEQTGTKKASPAAFFAAAFGVFALDQLTKLAVVANIPWERGNPTYHFGSGSSPIPVIDDFLYIVHITNVGDSLGADLPAVFNSPARARRRLDFQKPARLRHQMRAIRPRDIRGRGRRQPIRQNLLRACDRLHRRPPADYRIQVARIQRRRLRHHRRGGGLHNFRDNRRARKKSRKNRRREGSA